MNDLISLESWLMDSIKNRHYFYSDSARTNYCQEWRDAYSILFQELSNIKTRQGYLHWRAVWKATYKKLSDESRMMKGYRRPPNPFKSSNLRAGTEAAAMANIRHVLFLRVLANEFLDIRKTSKELAEERYQASLFETV